MGYWMSPWRCLRRLPAGLRRNRLKWVGRIVQKKLISKGSFPLEESFIFGKTSSFRRIFPLKGPKVAHLKLCFQPTGTHYYGNAWRTLHALRHLHPIAVPSAAPDSLAFAAFAHSTKMWVVALPMVVPVVRHNRVVKLRQNCCCQRCGQVHPVEAHRRQWTQKKGTHCRR